MTQNAYAHANPIAGLPTQRELTTDTAHFTEAYAVIPRGVLRDIVVSHLPFWEGMRAWTIARPLSGFAETFSQMIVELAPGGGSKRPELDKSVESVVFVTEGRVTLALNGREHQLDVGGYAFLSPDEQWQIHNKTDAKVTFHWVRKRYQAVEGLEQPDSFVTAEAEAVVKSTDPATNVWTTTRFVEPTDMRHDMHVNIVSFEPGGSIPFAETHVMEHGLFVLQGKAVYRLNRDWVEVEAGDFMWLRAFCPQACVAAGPEPFKYLLYKDVNRHPEMPGGFI